MPDDTPVLDTLAEMVAASLEHSDLALHDLALVRLAALIAVDAPAASYLLNLDFAVEAGLTLEDTQSVLAVVAPIVGAPRVVGATARIAEALGFAVELIAEEIAEEIEAES